MELLELIDNIKAEEAYTSLRNEGQRVRSRPGDPRYMQALAEAAQLLADVVKGKRPGYRLQEAMTTDDFPLLFADILDRQMLPAYDDAPVTWPQYVRRGTVPDFRQVERFTMDGAESPLDPVRQLTEYPEASIGEAVYKYKVAKFGRRLPFSWETHVNRELDRFQQLPEKLARAARRTEEKEVAKLYVGVNGPHGNFYTVGNGNIVTGNPVLGLAGLQTAMTQLLSMKDTEGNPISIEAINLVVGPALSVTADNILNSLQIEMLDQGGSTNQKLIAQNWMRGKVTKIVNPWIPILASTANGATSWWLFGSPSSGRPALEFGFLRGFESPSLWMKSPNALRVGGGQADAFEGDFDTDAIEYKVRHVLGGTQLDPKGTVASNGSGS